MLLNGKRTDGVSLLTPSELDFTAHLHIETLTVGLFPKLGVGFMKAHHSTYIDSPYALALVAHRDGAPIGMLFAVFDPEAHRVWMFRHRTLRLVGRGALAMTVRPAAASLFFRTRVGRYLRTLRAAIRASRAARRPISATAAGGHAPPPVVLAHVAVAPNGQGNGVGTALALELEARARAAGHTRAVLLTETGSDAERFYASHGWQLVSHVVNPDDIKLARYEKQL